MSAVRSTVETAARVGIPSLTLYAFSEENWKRRPRTEVDFLMRLLRRYLKQEVPTLKRNNIRLEYIGRQHELSPEVRERMRWARQETERNTGMVLTLALNYSGRSEIVDAFNSLVKAAALNGGIDHLRVDEDAIARHLYTHNLPDPDLVIRTSGEMRLSNFLLWQLAYAEIYVTPTLWPDFRGAQLLEAIEEYQKRERRYGGLGKAPGNGAGGAIHSHSARGTTALEDGDFTRDAFADWRDRVERADPGTCFACVQLPKPRAMGREGGAAASARLFSAEQFGDLRDTRVPGAFSTLDGGVFATARIAGGRRNPRECSGDRGVCGFPR